MGESRVTTLIAGVLSTGGVPNARVTTVIAEVLHSGGEPRARVTGLVAEVLHGLEALTAGGTGRKAVVVVVAGRHAGSSPPDLTQAAATRTSEHRSNGHSRHPPLAFPGLS